MRKQEAGRSERGLPAASPIGEDSGSGKPRRSFLELWLLAATLVASPSSAQEAARSKPEDASTSAAPKTAADAAAAAPTVHAFATLGASQGPFPTPPPTPEDQAVAQMLNAYWANFAKTGDPNGPGLPQWPRYDPGKNEILEFRPDGKPAAAPGPWKGRLDVTEAAARAAKARQ